MPNAYSDTTPNPAYRYQPKQVDAIIVRPFAFEFPGDLAPIWARDNPVRSHMFNGFSLTMPYLEPYLIKSMQEASGQIKEPALLDDIRGFNGQEARHYECHRRLNEILKMSYPELADVEARLAASYARLSKKSLRTRLAYNAGFESMTNGFTSWFINKRQSLFGGNCPYVSSFWLMHMIEETEHKTVAYDTYMACYGQYLPRALGVLHGSLHVIGFGFIGMFTALKRDGDLYTARRLSQLAREIWSLLRNVSPFLLRAMLPGYNPRCEDDPQWMKDWVAGHKKLPTGALLPLVDTQDPHMPVPFSGTATMQA